jgi:hypothetical protein
MSNVRLFAHVTLLFALFAVTACSNKQDETPKANEKPVTKTPSATGPLEVGDTLPPIELDSVATGKPISLTSEDGQLTFHDDMGEVSHPQAAVGFFSRY